MKAIGGAEHMIPVRRPEVGHWGACVGRLPALNAVGPVSAEAEACRRIGILCGRSEAALDG